MNNKIFSKIFNKKNDPVNFYYQVFFSAIEDILISKNVCTRQELSDAIDAQTADLTGRQPPEMPMSAFIRPNARSSVPLTEKLKTLTNGDKPIQ